MIKEAGRALRPVWIKVSDVVEMLLNKPGPSLQKVTIPAPIERIIVWYSPNGHRKAMIPERLGPPVVRIRLSEVGTPPEMEMPCSCGGTLVYGTFHYSGEGPYCRVEAPQIWGYRCEDCDLKLYLPEMGEQLDERVLEALHNK